MSSLKSKAEYLAFPSTGSPRILVDSRSTISTALRLYNPSSPIGRAAKGVMNFLPDRLARVFLGNTENPKIDRYVETISGIVDAISSIDFYLSTDGGDDKIVAQVTTRPDHRIYIKMSTSDRFSDLIVNEAHALELLGEDRSLAKSIPDLLEHGTQGDIRYVAESSAAVDLTNRTLDLMAADIEILSRLTLIGRDTHPLMSTTDPIAELSRPESRLLELSNEHGRQFLHHASHGDYTPWNTLMGIDELYVFDWEHFSTDRTALYDVLHFHFMKWWLVENKSADENISGLYSLRSEALIQSLLSVIDLDPNDFEYYIAAFLIHHASWQRRNNVRIHDYLNDAMDNVIDRMIEAP